MKILFCTNAFDTVSNGPAKFARGLLHLQEVFPEHEVRILTEDSVQTSSSQVYRLTLRIPPLLKIAGMFIRMRAYHRKAMHIRKTEFPFDVLVYNNAVVGRFSARKFSCTYGFINDDNNALPPFAGRNKKEYLRQWIFHRIERACARSMQGIFVNSKYVRQLVIKKYTVPAYKVHLVYKAPGLTPAVIDKKNSIPHILFVKNDYLRGGLFTLISSLILLDREVQLTVIGPPGTAREQIANACANSKIKLAFLGIRSQEDVYASMRAADIFCVPSVREALGVANMEAMCFDCTIITTQVGGIPEVLDGGNCGWLVPPEDPETLADRIAYCLDHPEACAVKRASAREFVRTFNTEKCWKAFTEALLTHARRT